MILARLSGLNGKKLVEFVGKFWFVYSHTARSHTVCWHSDGRITVIPYHSGEEIGPGLLNKIIKKDLGITREEFLKKI
ncbi:MAG TPA: addiction module toxin, HicA family [Nitrospirae bacterium]|nr:addiction module toxin, HicA family [Nitrospirota bacterium]